MLFPVLQAAQICRPRRGARTERRWRKPVWERCKWPRWHRVFLGSPNQDRIWWRCLRWRSNKNVDLSWKNWSGFELEILEIKPTNWNWWRCFDGFVQMGWIPDFEIHGESHMGWIPVGLPVGLPNVHHCLIFCWMVFFFLSQDSSNMAGSTRTARSGHSKTGRRDPWRCLSWGDSACWSRSEVLQV